MFAIIKKSRVYTVITSWPAASYGFIINLALVSFINLFNVFANWRLLRRAVRQNWFFADRSLFVQVWIRSLGDRWVDFLFLNTGIRRYKLFNQKNYISSYAIVRAGRFISFLTGVRAILIFIKDPSLFFSNTDITFLRFYLNSFFLHRFPYLNIVNPHEFFFYIYYSFKWMDFKWSFQLLQKCLNKLLVFKHKMFLLFFFKYILRDFVPLFKRFGIRGFFISVRGKIGVAGNARKRRIFLNINETSRFNLNFRLYSYKNIFNTIAGALGFQLWVFYL